MGRRVVRDVARPVVTRIILAEEARADVLEAFQFYESCRPGLGTRFRDHLNLAITRIQNNPERAMSAAPVEICCLVVTHMACDLGCSIGRCC